MAVVLSPTARAALRGMDGVTGPGPSRAPRGEKTGGAGFGQVLEDAMTEAGEAERAAEATATQFAKGQAGIHETIVAQERAGVAVRYAVTLKNKALEAYREIMNTQV